jgi:integrase
MFKVYVVDYNRSALMLRARDSATGRTRCRSARTRVRRDAERAAGVWEAELNNGRTPADRLSWDDFCELYEAEALAGLATNTRQRWFVIADRINSLALPRWLSEFTPSYVSRLQSLFRQHGLAEATIASELKMLKAALNWAVSMHYLADCPAFPRIRRAKHQKVMKGRPITDAEFQKMLAAVSRIVPAAHVAAWQRYLRGLWLSGLRLEESLNLYWDRRDRLCIDASGKFPLLWIPSEHEKGNTNRLMPIVPDFACFLDETPIDQRRGVVFPLPKRRDRQGRHPSGKYWVSRTVCAIGRAAGIIVDTRHGTKYASAHDLRRSFGERWALRVMPQELMDLMRHESVETTLRYYVGRNAQQTASRLWQQFGNKSGNTPAKKSRKS